MADYDWEFDDEGTGFLPGLLLGALLGAAGALFVAAKRSGELRLELAELRDKAQTVTSTASERGAHLLQTAREAAGEVAQTASEAASSVAEGAREAVHHAQEAVQSAGSAVSSAQETAASVAQVARERVGDVAQTARDTADGLKTSVASALPHGQEPSVGDDEEDLAASGLETDAAGTPSDGTTSESSSENSAGGAAPETTSGAEEGGDTEALAAQLEDALHHNQDEVLEVEADADDAAVGLEGRDFPGTSEGSTGKRNRKKKNNDDQSHDVIDAV